MSYPDNFSSIDTTITCDTTCEGCGEDKQRSYFTLCDKCKKIILKLIEEYENRHNNR